jgi:hypothetical protein
MDEKEPGGIEFSCFVCQIAGKETRINLGYDHPICPVCGTDYLQTKKEVEAEEDKQFMGLVHKNIKQFLKEKSE